jgi:hypothetical protein
MSSFLLAPAITRSGFVGHGHTVPPTACPRPGLAPALAARSSTTAPPVDTAWRPRLGHGHVGHRAAHRLPSARPRTGPGSALINDGTVDSAWRPCLGRLERAARPAVSSLATTPRPPRTRRTARRQQPSASRPDSASSSTTPPFFFGGKRGVILLNHPSSTLSFLPFPPMPPCQLRLLPKLPVWWRRRGVCCYFPTYPGSSVTFLQANLPCIPILLSSASKPTI